MKKLEDVKKIAIIGGGAMGHGCAMVFAGAGYPVGLYSRRAETLEKAITGMRADLTFLAERGLGKLEDVEPTIARVTTTQEMEEAAADANGCPFEFCQAHHQSLPQCNASITLKLPEQ